MVFARIQAFPDPYKKFGIGRINHITKPSRVFKLARKYVIVNYPGQTLPNQTHLLSIQNSSIDAIIFDFPGHDEPIDEWEKNFSEFRNLLTSTSLSFGFKLHDPEPENFTKIIDRVVEDYRSDPFYFRIEGGMFFEYRQREDKNYRQQLRKYKSDIFPCAIVDDKRSITTGYHDGVSCFMALGDQNSYVWSANPSNWGDGNNAVKGMASMFVPVVMDKYRSADYRHHQYESYETDLDYPEPPPPDFPNPLPDDPEERDRVMEEHDRLMREHRERMEEREMRRKKRAEEKMKNSDPRSNFKYSFDFANQVQTQIIAIQASSGDLWISDGNFTNEVNNVTIEFKNK
ncbi:hypothetical protein TVAG_269180 [Trichomonas vaginalis G3]|uniref:Uncharacterized protein n=1 Tax=Trichomonas vaginalis (strain ATCC PRA-98 / G3) TaxID=412133 RepID=A2EG31_TRIV3|nr:glycosidases domain-containing protein [Trichomonas vaginalis G3]EAY08392.1 hypothetical protein TVAG_269180 [Trichomonas vaginalis G3]KAI5499329.1 glycosidases domain-containing protein [Trichomonas vaginalis G3]|eukprot:XP_001320615.1 hypothetical protein [Trichomonas vaginalis G3]